MSLLPSPLMHCLLSDSSKAKVACGINILLISSVRVSNPHAFICALVCHDPFYDIDDIYNVITIVVIVMTPCQKFCYFSNVHDIVVQIHVLDLGTLYTRVDIFGCQH